MEKPRVLIAILASAIALPAAAAPDGSPPGSTAFVGAWRMGHDGEGARTCVVRLNRTEVIGGYQIEAPHTCEGAVDRYDELFAWFINPGGELVMVDAARQAVYRFHRMDGAGWASEGLDDERYLLEKANAPAPAR